MLFSACCGAINYIVCVSEMELQRGILSADSFDFSYLEESKEPAALPASWTSGRTEKSEYIKNTYNDGADVTKFDKQISQFVNISNDYLVLITSGCPSITLDNDEVLSLHKRPIWDGSVFAEAFLAKGYRVIYLHHVKEPMPFSRSLHDHIAHTSLMENFITSGRKAQLSGSVAVQMQYASAVKCFKEATERCHLLNICYDSIEDYMYLMRQCSQHMAPLGNQVIWLLATDLPPYYVPRKTLTLSKSTSTIKLEPTPQLLPNIRTLWAPKGLVVYVNQGTNDDHIHQESKAMVEKYDVDIVIGLTKRVILIVESFHFYISSAIASVWLYLRRTTLLLI